MSKYQLKSGHGFEEVALVRLWFCSYIHWN